MTSHGLTTFSQSIQQRLALVTVTALRTIRAARVWLRYQQQVAARLDAYAEEVRRREERRRLWMR
jgi:hypothetical protein